MALNFIPEMTDPLGRSWIQPSTSEILITDHAALMSQRAFDKLHVYSTTVPTGVYPGKMWRCTVLEPDGKEKHYLRWYGECKENPRMCTNNQREILIQDWKNLYGVKDDTPHP